MPSLRQRLTVQQILLIEIDLRQMLLPDLHLNPASCTGGVPAAIVIERKTQCLRGLQKSQSMRNLAAFAFRVKKSNLRHIRHYTSRKRLAGLRVRTGRDPGRLIRTPFEENMFLKFMPKQTQTALYQHSGAGHQGAIP